MIWVLLALSFSDSRALAVFPLPNPPLRATQSCLLSALRKLDASISSNPQDDLPRPPRYEDFTVADLVARGNSLQTALKKKGIPVAQAGNYNPDTGRFRENSLDPLLLAPENGDAELSALRMNWDPWDDGKSNKSVSRAQFDDMVKVMKEKKNLQLIVAVGTPENFKEAETAVAGLPRGLRRRVTLVQTDQSDIEMWSQDGSKPLLYGLKTLLPGRLTRGGNKYEPVIDRLQKARVLRVDKTAFVFEGGNIVVGARHIFVGPDVVYENMMEFNIGHEEALNALSAEFGKPVIEVGATDEATGLKEQIDFHIDLTMAAVRDRATGKEVVLLESQRKAFELLAGERNLESLPKDPRAFFHELIQGRLKPKSAAPRAKTQGERDLIAAIGAMDEDLFVKRELGLKEVERELRGRGYDVILVPGFNQLKADMDTTDSTIIFNYTNSIFSGDHAIIPEMGVRVWDRYFQNVMKRLGYSLTTTAIPQRSLCAMGGIRCTSETFRMPIQPVFQTEQSK